MPSKIYTRTGDKGQTGIIDGQRLEKSALRIQVLGDVDELNCQLGVLTAYIDDIPTLQTQLLAIQSRLFELGAELAMPKSLRLSADDIQDLERQIDKYNANLPLLRNFILPTGTLSVSHCHLSRAVCRRAERQLCALVNHEFVNPHSLAYLNRLSDYLFILARYLAKHSNTQEQQWQPQNK